MNIIGRLINFISGRQATAKDDHADATTISTPEFPHILVPEEVVISTIEGLQSHSPGCEDHEGVVYWAGVEMEDLNMKLVTTCIVPDALTTPGSFTVPAEADAEVVQAIHDHDLQGIGHVHTHPGSWAGHSNGDDEGAGLVFDGYYSIVVPNYGRNGLRPFTQCGVHCYERGQFRELDDEEIEQTVISIPSPPDYLDLRTG